MTWTAEGTRTAPARAAIRATVFTRTQAAAGAVPSRSSALSPAATDPADLALAAAAPVDLTPVSARAAVGRYTGLSRSRPATPAPVWRSAGIVGLVALIAAAATPVIAEILTVAG